jgi:hypothetical protein
MAGEWVTRALLEYLDLKVTIVNDGGASAACSRAYARGLAHSLMALGSSAYADLVAAVESPEYYGRADRSYSNDF